MFDLGSVLKLAVPFLEGLAADSADAAAEITEEQKARLESAIADLGVLAEEVALLRSKRVDTTGMSVSEMSALVRERMAEARG